MRRVDNDVKVIVTYTGETCWTAACTDACEAWSDPRQTGGTADPHLRGQVRLPAIQQRGIESDA